MDITDQLERADAASCKRILGDLLTSYCDPAFGTLPKREVDLLFLKSLEDVGFVQRDSSIYELVQKLRVTRSKARSLYYDLELRRLDVSKLDQKVREALKHPVIQKQGELFALEVENPVVSDHFRAIVQSLNHVTDGSFSPSLVKLNADAFSAVVEYLLDEKTRESVRKALIKAGVPDDSFQGMLKAVLKKVGAKMADEAGSEFAEKAGDYLGPIIDGATKRIGKEITSLYRSVKAA